MRGRAIAKILTGSMLLMAAACGGSDERAKDESGGNEAANAVAAAEAAWNAADACALADKDMVAGASGRDVSGTQLTAGPTGEGLATFSTCTYTLADGGIITVLTRKSPTPDFSAEAVEMARTANGMMPAAEDVPNLGRAALWTKETKTLQVFIDDTRYVTITAAVTGGKAAKDVATAIASALVA